MLSIQQKEESKNNEQKLKCIKDYKHKVEEEISKICSDILLIIDDHLVPSSSTGESRVFYFKMKGDYYRYLAEFKTENERKEAADQSLKAYESASNIAVTDLAFDEAIAAVDTLREESYKDSTLIMHLLKNNLTLWTSDRQDDTDEDQAKAMTRSGLKTESSKPSSVDWIRNF